MKPIKRLSCPVCKNRLDTTEIKKIQKCPKDGAPMVLSDQWYVRATINGKREYVPCGLLKRDAEDYIATYRIARRTGSILPGQEKDISWADAKKNCEGWWDAALLATDKNKIKPKTREHYKNQVRILDKYLYGLSLLTITKTVVKSMMDDLSRHHSPASVAHAVKALKRMYAMHIENLDLEETPRPKLIEKTFIISKVSTPVVENQITVSCDETGLQSVLGHIQTARGKKLDKQRLRLAILLGVGMLMRPINICGLEWAEVDLAGGVIRIKKDKMKGKKDFEQAIPGPVLAELKAWRLETGLSSLYVFPSPQDAGKPMITMGRAIRRHIGVVGLNANSTSRQDKVTPYVLTRHTGATQLYEESGDNLEMTSQAAGHADSRITRERYVKNRISHAKRTAIPIQEAMIKRMAGIKDAA